ncbi:hypothetical protein ACLBR5_23775 [Escherichia coli]
MRGKQRYPHWFQNYQYEVNERLDVEVEQALRNVVCEGFISARPRRLAR